MVAPSFIVTIKYFYQTPHFNLTESDRVTFGTKCSIEILYCSCGFTDFVKISLEMQVRFTRIVIVTGSVHNLSCF